MHRGLTILVAAALLSGCDDQAKVIQTAQLDLALAGISKAEKQQDAPENALSTVWARQDAIAVANCEATRIRMDRPDTREAAIVGAAVARDLPYDDYYADPLKSELRALASPANPDCSTLAQRLDRQILRRDPLPDGSVALVVAVHNILKDPSGVAALDGRAAKARNLGAQYRYTLVKPGEVWLISKVETYEGGAFRPYLKAASPLVEAPAL